MIIWPFCQVSHQWGRQGCEPSLAVPALATPHILGQPHQRHVQQLVTGHGHYMRCSHHGQLTWWSAGQWRLSSCPQQCHHTQLCTDSQPWIWMSNAYVGSELDWFDLNLTKLHKICEEPVPGQGQQLGLDCLVAGSVIFSAWNYLTCINFTNTKSFQLSIPFWFHLVRFAILIDMAVESNLTECLYVSIVEMGLKQMIIFWSIHVMLRLPSLKPMSSIRKKIFQI